MTKSARSAAARLLPPVPGTGRRQQFSAGTKRTLVDVAADLFTEHGYANTSLDSIVAGAEVTKGALYHHFSGKQGLFEAVFERVEGDAARRIQSAIKGIRDPWEKATAGLRAFLEVVREPTYRRVVIQDGPAVLGYERFREREERSSFASVLEIVRAVLSAGDWDLDEEMLQTFARVFFGAMSAAGDSVSLAQDPEVASARVEVAVTFLLAGVRTMVDAGVDLADVMPGEA